VCSDTRDLFLQCSVGVAAGSDAEKCHFQGEDVADVKRCAKANFINVLDRLDGFQLVVSSEADPLQRTGWLQGHAKLEDNWGSSPENPLYVHKRTALGTTYILLTYYLPSYYKHLASKQVFGVFKA
jgi:hypothetical protein